MTARLSDLVIVLTLGLTNANLQPFPSGLGYFAQPRFGQFAPFGFGGGVNGGLNGGHLYSGFNGGLLNNGQLRASGSLVNPIFGYRPFGYPFGQVGGYYNGDGYNKQHHDANGHGFKEEQGAQGNVVKHENQGYNSDQALVKDSKEQAAFSQGAAGEHNNYDIGKVAHGSNYANAIGKEEEETKQRKAHKKGHDKKGFKTTSHKTEEEKSESFWDSSHDEADDERYKGNKEVFKDTEASKFNKEQEDAAYHKADKGQKEAFEKASALDVKKGEKGEFGEKKFVDQKSAFENKNKLGAQSVLGHHEAEGQLKHYGSNSIPIF